jgi:hypothetical protein
VILSIFSCAYFPSVDLLQWGIYSGALVIFNQVIFFFWKHWGLNLLTRHSYHLSHSTSIQVIFLLLNFRKFLCTLDNSPLSDNVICKYFFPSLWIFFSFSWDLTVVFLVWFGLYRVCHHAWHPCSLISIFLPINEVIVFSKVHWLLLFPPM